MYSEKFKNHIKPFSILRFSKNNFSISLNQEDYYYDWLREKKISPTHYGDGHCYNDLFKDYLDNNFKDLNNYLTYDSENGMFCVYCTNEHKAVEVCFELSKLYNDEEKMIKLIKETKQKYGYVFEKNIKF